MSNATRQLTPEITSKFLRNGRFFPNPELSHFEDKLFNNFTSNLRCVYLSLPSLIEKKIVNQQGLSLSDSNVFGVSGEVYDLAGSAEQGFLEYFASCKDIAEGSYYSLNQCFRNEEQISGLKTLKEFKKLELFSIRKTRLDSLKDMQKFIDYVLSFYKNYKLETRVVDLTREKQPGEYFEIKFDIEILTETYGWLEMNSCTFFGTEQMSRFGVSDYFTVSCTGLASPRILIPFLERKNLCPIDW